MKAETEELLKSTKDTSPDKKIEMDAVELMKLKEAERHGDDGYFKKKRKAVTNFTPKKKKRKK